MKSKSKEILYLFRSNISNPKLYATQSKNALLIEDKLSADEKLPSSDPNKTPKNKLSEYRSMKRVNNSLYKKDIKTENNQNLPLLNRLEGKACELESLK